jgi:hypothetical protein
MIEQPKDKGDRYSLTPEKIKVLDLEVLPVARRWVEKYEPGTTLHMHGMQTLRYWNEVPHG